MNMKFSLGLLGILCSSAAVAHESGFYTGAGAVLSNGQANTAVKVTGNGGTDHNNYSFNISKTSGNLDLFGGYQKYFGSSFMGAEAFINPLQDSAKKTNEGTWRGFGNVGVIMFQNIQLKTVRKFSAGVRFKYGRHFDNKTAAFLSLGLLGSQFKVRHADASPQTVNYQKFLFGYAPGAGLKYYIKPHLPLSLQYEYQIYNLLTTKNMTDPAVSPGDNIQYKMKNRYHSFTLSLSCEL